MQPGVMSLLIAPSCKSIAKYDCTPAESSTSTTQHKLSISNKRISSKAAVAALLSLIRCYFLIEYLYLKY